MAEKVVALQERWLGNGLPANAPVELSKMAATLRAVLEAVKLSSAKMTTIHTVSFKESAVQMRNVLTKIEAEHVQLTFKDILLRPHYKETVLEFVSKASVILGTIDTPQLSPSLSPAFTRTSSDASAMKSIEPSNLRSTSDSPFSSSPQADRKHSREDSLTDPRKNGTSSPSTPSSPALHELSQAFSIAAVSLFTPEILLFVGVALGETLPTGDIMTTAALFKDGIRFCRLINAYFPNAIIVIHNEPEKQFRCVQNLQAFLTECKTRLGVSKEQLFDPLDVYNLTGKGVLQVGNTLSTVVTRLRELNVKTIINTPSMAPSNVMNFVSKNSGVTLPANFIHLPSAAPALPINGKSVDAMQPSTRRLRDYKLYKSFDDGKNLFRCVDSAMRRVTVQHIDSADVDDDKLAEVVSVLSKNYHPFVMSVSAYWYEKDAVYLEMPFYSHYTFKEWLYKTNPKPAAVQKAFAQIMLGLAYLHENGLIHGRLDMDAIVMGLDDVDQQIFPIICCLGFASSSNPSKKSESPSSSHDVYCLGKLIYQSVIGGKIPYKESKQLNIEKLPAKLISDKLLMQVLPLMLQRKPTARPSAASLSTLPYFSTPFFEADKTLLRPLQALQHKINQMRVNSPPGFLLLEVDSNDITPSMLAVFPYLDTNDFLREIFYIPSNYKAGAANARDRPQIQRTRLKALMLRTFWHNVIHGGYYLEAFNIDGSISLVPSRQRRDPALYKALGLVILKSMIDRTKVPSAVALLAYRAFKWARLNVLNRPIPKKVPLADFEKSIIETWQPQLAALAEGLNHLKLLEGLEALDFLTYTCGADYITNHMLRVRHEFYDFSLVSPTPMHIRDYLDSLSPAQLRLLLLWTTSQVDLEYLIMEKMPQGNSVGFREGPFMLKWINRSHDLKQPTVVAFGSVGLFELEDADDFNRAMDTAMKAVAV